MSGERLSENERQSNMTPIERASELSTHPNLTHGFFSREGGVSEGIYASLNCGFGSDDKPEHVTENRTRVAARLGVPFEHLLTVYQIHSPNVIHVTEPWAPNAAPQADAMVTTVPGLALGILAADCGPVLFADAKAGVVGAAHSGWKGAIGGVLENTVVQMEALGAARDRITAAIGPCISQANYEVGPEFRDRFVDEDPKFSGFFVDSPQSESSDRCHFDLPGFIEARLQGLGVGHVDRADVCTYADENYFSYRQTTHRGEADYGRNISVIVLNSN